MYLDQDPCVPRMKIAVPCSGHALALHLPSGMGGRVEKGFSRSVFLEICARNVSCPSRAVSITPVPVGLAGSWWLVWLGREHLRGPVGTWEGGKD